MYDFKQTEKEARKIWTRHQKKIGQAIEDDSKKKVFLEALPRGKSAQRQSWQCHHHLKSKLFFVHCIHSWSAS